MIECDMLIAQAKAARAARDLGRAVVLYGAAVQCLNLALDLEETTGLTTVGLAP